MINIDKYLESLYRASFENKNVYSSQGRVINDRNEVTKRVNKFYGSQFGWF